MEHGSLTVIKEKFQLPKLVIEMMDTFLHEASRKNISLFLNGLRYKATPSMESLVSHQSSEEDVGRTKIQQFSKYAHGAVKSDEHSNSEYSMQEESEAESPEDLSEDSEGNKRKRVQHEDSDESTDENRPQMSSNKPSIVGGNNTTKQLRQQYQFQSDRGSNKYIAKEKHKEREITKRKKNGTVITIKEKVTVNYYLPHHGHSNFDAEEVENSYEQSLEGIGEHNNINSKGVRNKLKKEKGKQQEKMKKKEQENNKLDVNVNNNKKNHKNKQTIRAIRTISVIRRTRTNNKNKQTIRTIRIIKTNKQ